MLCKFFLLREIPVRRTIENIQSSNLMFLLFYVSSMKELLHPSVPVLIELLQDLQTLTLLTEGVIYRVNCKQFEVLQSPVVGNRSHEVVSSAVLHSETTRVSHVHCHRIA